jgi:DNA replication protein DnaC
MLEMAYEPKRSTSRDSTGDDLTRAVAGIFGGGEAYVDKLRREGPYRCQMCKQLACELPGICDECACKHAEQQKQERIAKAVKTIPVAWQWASFREPQVMFDRISDRAAVRSTMALLRKLLAGETWITVLAGESGEGKTSLAAAMLRLAAEQHPEHMYLFIYAPRIARAYRNSPLGSTPPIIDACERASMLVIDDLGADAVYRDSLREVIQCREADRKPTVITTYLTEPEAREAYGGGISRRMYRDGWIVWVGGKPEDASEALEGPETGPRPSQVGYGPSGSSKGP